MSITVPTGTLPAAISEALNERPIKMYVYLEYTNSAGNIPAYTTVAVVPNFDAPLTYYTGLANTNNYLRVPAVRSPFLAGTSTPTTGQTITTYLAQSAPGNVGVNANGANFANGSICYGAALVVALDENDRTKDIVVARSYFTIDSERLTKTAASELFITFPFTVNSIKAT